MGAACLRHPRKDGAALALKPGEAKALERALRMFTEKALCGNFIIGAQTWLQVGVECCMCRAWWASRVEWGE